MLEVQDDEVIDPIKHPLHAGTRRFLQIFILNNAFLANFDEISA